MERFVLLSQGNSGALSVCKKLLDTQKKEIVDMILQQLEENHITGSDIWVIYKKCKQDIDLFILYFTEKNESV